MSEKTRQVRENLRGNINACGILDKEYARIRREVPHQIFRYKVRARIVVDAVEKYLGPIGPLRLLDFGSAEGLTLLELRSFFPFGTFVGVEYSDELLNSVPELPSEMRIVKGDVANLPDAVKDEPYDIVSALAVLDHLPEPLKAVREAVSVLRPGGIFVATCPHPAWDTIALRLGLLPGSHPEKCHLTGMVKGRMVDFAQQAGMEVLSFERFMWAPIGLLPYLKIPVSPSLSLYLDRILRGMRLFNWLFVNQSLVARKPL